MKPSSLLTVALLFVLIPCGMAQHTETVEVNNRKYTSYRSALYDVTGDARDKVLDLPGGSFVLLKKFRPDDYAFYQKWADKYGKSVEEYLMGIHNEISVLKAMNDKLWIGLSLYEGEGFTGYSGIGFYDPKSGQVGMLRHPAFTGCSIDDFELTDSTLYVKTFIQHELSAGVCNGLVSIDLEQFSARAVIPEGPPLLWTTEGEENEINYLEMSIGEIMSRGDFLPKEVSQWDVETKTAVSAVGVESFMLNTYKSEQELIEQAGN